MKAALIVMTIMGCDDSATQCHYIDTVDRSWQTVALCDAQAETYINRHQDKNYPVIVAVCESAGNRMTASDIVDVLRSRYDIRPGGSARQQAMEIARVLKRLGARQIRTNTWRGYEDVLPK